MKFLILIGGLVIVALVVFAVIYLFENVTLKGKKRK